MTDATESPFRTVELSDPRYEREGLRHVTVKSAALRGRADITLFVPGEPAPERSDTPLVILLHGVYGSHWAWSLQGGAHRTARALMRRGEIDPMVLAMPSDGLWGDGSGYLRHAEWDFERWIVEEVPVAAALAADRSEPWPAIFLAGLSMGGYGALRLAARYHEVFAGASGHSSITRFEQLCEFVEEEAALYRVPAEDHDALAVILEHRDRLPSLRFDCGTEDPLIEPNRELDRQLTAAGVPHTYEEFPGGHEWRYWEEHLADSLQFFQRLVRQTGS